MAVLIILVVLFQILLAQQTSGDFWSLENNFNVGFQGWTVAQQSWQRVSLESVLAGYPESLKPSAPITNETKNEEKNMVLVPYQPSGGKNAFLLSTMSREIGLPEGGQLEIFFSVFLLGWDINVTNQEMGRLTNPKLQIFYDEDMVFDLLSAVEEHKKKYAFTSWNQFKLLSDYREGINITVTVVGSRGKTDLPSNSSTNSTLSSLVLIDNFRITTRGLTNSSGLRRGRLEPEADIREDGAWHTVDTEARLEAADEEAEKGRPLFCSLKPESVPCGRTPQKRYFYNASSKVCESFMHECKGNENLFEDLETCHYLCADRHHDEPLSDTLRKTEFTSFENGFDGWSVRDWKTLNYSSNEAKRRSISAPPVIYPDYSNNMVGLTPEYHTFDFRRPELTQEFIVENNSMLIIEFQLLMKGGRSSGFLSLFFSVDPGLEIYVGNIKVFDFDKHGVLDERWHEYRIQMNRSEVEEHRVESGDKYLLITIRGWQGSGGNGLMVLDNLNITQVPEKENQITNTALLPSDRSTTMALVPVTSTTAPTANILPPPSNSNYCSEPKDTGVCKGLFTRYYYNEKYKACITFLWSGCGGSSNRFYSQSECEAECVGNSKGKSTAFLPKKDPEYVCALPKEKGNCVAKTEKYFFDVESGVCKSFTYSGCGMNANNFKTETECQTFCTSVTIKKKRTKVPGEDAVQDICRGPPDPGPCTDFTTMFYFNNSTGVCTKFSYGGCGGNQNRFSTPAECNTFCMSGVTVSTTRVTYPTVRPEVFNASVCGLPSSVGDCTGDIVRYYYSTFFENCFSFHWTGCGGNENNFATWSQCWMSCQPQEEDGQSVTVTTYSTAVEEEDTRHTMVGVREQEDISEEQDKYSLLPLIKDKDHTPAHVCSLKYETGPCTPIDPVNYKTRYFHNITTGKCEKFLYGGCGGNHNNFLNYSDCLAFCQPSGEEKASRRSEAGIMVVINKFNQSSCFVSPRHGHCNGQFLRWYYSRWDNICKPYNYTGCNANQNSFISKMDCEDFCPKVEVEPGADRCDRLRERGSCDLGQTRFFYDKYSNVCIRFTACAGVPSRENNFATREDCRSTCFSNRTAGEYFPLNFTAAGSQATPLGEEGGGVSAQTIVEVILVFVIIGLLSFAGLLMWRHFQAKRTAEAYNLFRDDNRESTDSRRESSMVNFENPTYSNEIYDVDRDLDRNIQIPPLSLRHLGVIHELPEQTNSSVA